MKENFPIKEFIVKEENEIEEILIEQLIEELFEQNEDRDKK